MERTIKELPIDLFSGSFSFCILQESCTIHISQQLPSVRCRFVAINHVDGRLSVGAIDRVDGLMHR